MIEKIIKNYKELINYLIVGILTTVVSLGSYCIATLTIFNPEIAWQLQVANIISWICSVTFAFLMNRKYVFKSENIRILEEAIKFYIARLFTLFLDMGCMFLFVTICLINDKIAKLLVQVIVLALNYILSKFIVFQGERK